MGPLSLLDTMDANPKRYAPPDPTGFQLGRSRVYWGCSMFTTTEAPYCTFTVFIEKMVGDIPNRYPQTKRCIYIGLILRIASQGCHYFPMMYRYAIPPFDTQSFSRRSFLSWKHTAVHERSFHETRKKTKQKAIERLY